MQGVQGRGEELRGDWGCRECGTWAQAYGHLQVWDEGRSLAPLPRPWAG